MSQIATRNDVNSKCTGSMASGVECPTKKEINNTALVGVNGDYGDNECVKIEDLSIGFKSLSDLGKRKSIQVIVVRGANAIDINHIKFYIDNSMSLSISPRKSDYNGYLHFFGDRSNLSTMKIDIGDFGAARKIYWSDATHNRIFIGESKSFTWDSGYHWNKWVNENTWCKLEIDT